MHTPSMDRHVVFSPCADQPAPSNGEAPRMEMCLSLYRAARSGRAEKVMALLLQQPHGAGAGHRQVADNQHGQSCNILEVSAGNNTALHLAAEQGRDEVITEIYVKLRDNDLLISRRNSNQDTPLHCAARMGRDKAVSVLIQLAEDNGERILGCKNNAGDTALHLAARHGHATTVEALVSAAPEVSSELNDAGVSPLYLAVMSRSLAAVKAITTYCRDASSVGPSSQNALHAAIFQTSEMVDMLLQWMPSLAEQLDVNGSSPLHFASSDGNLSVVSLILQAQPNTVYLQDSSGLSALHVAARMGHGEVVARLTEDYPDAAELRDGHGQTFLHAAAKAGDSSAGVSLAIGNQMMSSLLNAQDRDGNTPLHLAVVAGASTVVKTLMLDESVRPDIINNDGQTPFDLAAKTNSFFTMIRLVVTLTAYGAKPRPQRQDDGLNQWSGRDTQDWVRDKSDILAVVAVLLATVAFSATFNVPGGYRDDGKAVLHGTSAYKVFIVVDSVAMTASVVAAMLLVYGKASGSWKSFVLSVHLIWVSLINMVVAFMVASVAVTGGSATYDTVIFEVIYLGIYVLVISIVHWIKPAPSWITIAKFIWGSFSPDRRHIYRRVARKYPFAGPYLRNLTIFVVINIVAYFAIFLIMTSTSKLNL